jgi:hypothetical protein
MGARRSLGLLLVLAILSAGAASAPTRCPDGCADEREAACVDCPLCSPARAPMLVGDPDRICLQVPVSLREAVLTHRLSRPEDRDVFHVPRPA